MLAVPPLILSVQNYLADVHVSLLKRAAPKVDTLNRNIVYSQPRCEVGWFIHRHTSHIHLRRQQNQQAASSRDTRRPTKQTSAAGIRSAATQQRYIIFSA